jgi:hypothetical protein
VTSKLRIRIGEVEVEYEGPEEFLKKDLPQLLRTAIELHGIDDGADAETKPKKKTHASHAGGAMPSLTTGSIASKLDVKVGSDLLKAAAAHMTFVAKKETFSRQELLAEMQKAKSYYKTSYSGNLSKYFKAALAKDGFLTETSTNAYALKAAARTDLERKLADE